MTKISNQYSLTNILTADLANSRLGINNVSPTVALDVTGAGKFSSTLQCSGAFIQANQTEIFASAGASNRAYAFSVGNVAAGDFTISQGSTATGGTYTTRLTINPSGNVGIGTTSPSAKLEVNGFGTANSIMTYVCAKFYGFGTGGLNIGTDGTNAQIATDSSGVDLTFLTRVSGVFSERMRITSAGNVGIGTSSPGYSLHVNGTAYAVGHIGGYVTASSGYVNETQTITTNGTSYYLRKYTGNANGSSTTIFNITGLNTANGTFADIYAVAQKDATGSAINTNLEVQINGQYMYGIQANGTAANTRICAFKVCRMDSSWVIIGTVRT